MSTVMMSVLVMLSLFLICYPVLKSKLHGTMPEAEWATAQNIQNSRPNDKDVIMNTLSEIEFDFHMNKLSDEDYQFLKTDYAKAALAIMDSEKPLTVQTARNMNSDNLLESIDREIEEELQAMELSK